MKRALGNSMSLGSTIYWEEAAESPAGHATASRLEQWSVWFHDWRNQHRSCVLDEMKGSTRVGSKIWSCGIFYLGPWDLWKSWGLHVKTTDEKGSACTSRSCWPIGPLPCPLAALVWFDSTPLDMHQLQCSWGIAWIILKRAAGPEVLFKSPWDLLSPRCATLPRVRFPKSPILCALSWGCCVFPCRVFVPFQGFVQMLNLNEYAHSISF